MSDPQAKINSVEALRQFQQQTLLFNEEALQTLGHLRTELNRMCHHVEFEVPSQLKHEHEKWQKILIQANNELLNKTKQSSEAQQMKRKAVMRINELEQRMEKAQKWKQKLSALIDQPESEILKLKNLIINDMSKSTQLLAQHADTLDSYIQGSQS